MGNITCRARFETERSRDAATFTGSFQTLGAALTSGPVIMIVDNQTTVTVQLSVDGVNVWKTFPAGEAIVLDLRANSGQADNFYIDANTQFYVNGAAGTGLFCISILTAPSR